MTKRNSKRGAKEAASGAQNNISTFFSPASKSSRASNVQSQSSASQSSRLQPRASQSSRLQSQDSQSSGLQSSALQSSGLQSPSTQLSGLQSPPSPSLGLQPPPSLSSGLQPLRESNQAKRGRALDSVTVAESLIDDEDNENHKRLRRSFSLHEASTFDHLLEMFPKIETRYLRYLIEHHDSVEEVVSHLYTIGTYLVQKSGDDHGMKTTSNPLTNILGLDIEKPLGEKLLGEKLLGEKLLGEKPLREEVRVNQVQPMYHIYTVINYLSPAEPSHKP